MVRQGRPPRRLPPPPLVAVEMQGPPRDTCPRSTQTDAKCCVLAGMRNEDDPAFYGETWADTYDDEHGGDDPSMAVDLLVELAGDGPVLELGIGTGRVALPLAARGVAVEGVEASPSMLARLRSKPGGADIPVALGDMSELPATGEFSLVYIVFNGLFYLMTQEQQLRCITNAARLLEPGGTFAIECFMPDPTKLDWSHQRIGVTSMAADAVELQLSRDHPHEQLAKTKVVLITTNGIQFKDHNMRYAWPSEIDLMARMAGLRLVDRYGDWDRSAFTAHSNQHISIYQRPTATSSD